MDLRTRAITRITIAPPAQYRLQHTPVVAGDWVVWSDFRDASWVNSDSLFADVMEIYAYNFTTGREYPILTGPYRAESPMIVDGQVYFTCVPNDPTAGLAGMFSVPLPTP